MRGAAVAWLAEHPKVTSGDVAALTGMAQPNASTAMSTLARNGGPIARGDGAGRGAHFVARA